MWMFVRHVYKIAKMWLLVSCLFVCPSVCNNSAPTGWIFMKFDIWAFVENLSRKFKFHWNLMWITGTSPGDISRWVLMVRNVSDSISRENQNTHFMFNNFFRQSWCSWDSVKNCGTARQATDNNIILLIRTACWLTKATDTHLEYVIFIAFSRQ